MKEYVDHPWINSNTIERRNYQENIVKTAINANTLVVIPTGLGKCHSYDDLILLDNGDLREIGEIVEKSLRSSKRIYLNNGFITKGNPENLKVMSLTESGFKPARILGFCKLKAKKTIEIETKSGIRIEVTPEHPLLTISKNLEWINASTLRENDWIVIPKKIRINSSEGKIDFFDLFKNAPGKGAMIKLKNGKELELKKFKGDEEILGIFYRGGKSTKFMLLPIWNLSPDLARFLGLVTAEGVIRSGIRFYNEDPILLHDFKILSQKLFHLDPIEIEGGLLLRSTALFYFLKFAFNMTTSHSRDKDIPNIVLKGSDEIIGNYLSGLYDGEGSVRGDGLIEFITASKNIAKKLPYFLLRSGIVCRVKRKKARATNSPKCKVRTYYRIYIEGKEDIAKFREFVGFKHPEKKKKIEKIINSDKGVNTNVDVFPVNSILKSIRKDLGLVTSRNKDFKKISDFSIYERNIRKPSRTMLKYLVHVFRKRYKKLKRIENEIKYVKNFLGILENLDKILVALRKNKNYRQILKDCSVSISQLNNWIRNEWKPKIKNSSPVIKLLKKLGYDVNIIRFYASMNKIKRELKISWYVLGKEKLFMLYTNPEKLSRLLSFILKKWERIEKTEDSLDFLEKLLKLNVQFDKIKGVKVRKKDQWVYDICTETGNFIAGDYGGLISHNTSIAALVTAHRLEENPDEKILFLAPTRPLVNQHKKTFECFLKTGLELKVVTGFNKPEERKELYKADIIFSTPQTIRNDLEKGIINLRNYSLLIVDEAHRAVGNYAYPYVAKIYMQQSKNPLILALTASPGSFRYKINEVKQNLFIKNVEIRTREDSDVRPYVQELKQEWVEVELSPEMKEIKKLLEKVKEERINKLLGWKIIHSPMISKSQMIKKQEELAKKKTGMGYAAMSLLAAVLKVDHALTLLETQCIYSLKRYFENLSEQNSRAVSRLMKDENFNSAIRLTNELIKQGKEHPKIEKLKEIVGEELERNKYCNIIIFVQFRDTITRIMQTMKEIPLAAPVEFIGQAKKFGKGLSQKEQIEILNEFKLGFYNILLATQIGEEGLDIEETGAVIFYEPIPSAIRKIQRTGRTARTKPGKVIVLMTKDTRDEAYHWSSYHKEVKMKKMLYSMKKQRELSEFSNVS